MKIASSTTPAVSTKAADAKAPVKKETKKEASTKKAMADASTRSQELKESKAAKAALATEKAKLAAPPSGLAGPAVEVSITAREPTEEEKANQKGYTPQEVRAKAKTFLQSGNLPPEQREVLEAILKKEEDAEKAALKKRIKEAKG